MAGCPKSHNRFNQFTYGGRPRVASKNQFRKTQRRTDPASVRLTQRQHSVQQYSIDIATIKWPSIVASYGWPEEPVEIFLRPNIEKEFG